MMAQYNTLTLVLLPGMDGTGKLFAPLLPHLSEYDCKVITLPQSGDQDYSTLTKFVKDKLPTGDFILIAESFSGPIAAHLAQQDINHLKGIIFVATFLSSPNPFLLKIAKRLPLKLLNKLPGSGFFQRNLFCGKDSDPNVLDLFQDAVEQVPSNVLKQRMQTMQILEFLKFNNPLPTAYILPKSDLLVASSKVLEFQKCFDNLVIERIEGPHFILQAQPKICAEIIREKIKSI